MASETVKYSIVKLNDKNYQTWKYEMELLLIERDLFEYTTKEKPKDNAPKDWDKLDGKARAAIGLCVEKGQQQHIWKCKTAYETWKILKEIHQRKSLATKIRLLRKLMNTKLAEDGNMSDHLDECPLFSIQRCKLNWG